MTRDFRHCLRERVLIFDGAMGTSIQDRNLTLDDFEGKDGCNEILVLTRPQVIREIHAGFLAVGCDAIETNTFGASRLVLGEYDLADQAYEINRAAARLAREVAADFSTPDRPRFVVGAIGPGTRLPSLGQIGFDDLVAMLTEQARGLIEELRIFVAELGFPCSLKQVGLKTEDIGPILEASKLSTSIKTNPRPLDDSLRAEVLAAAIAG